MTTFGYGVIAAMVDVSVWLLFEMVMRRHHFKMTARESVKSALSDRPNLAWMACWMLGLSMFCRLVGYYSFSVVGFLLAAGFFIVAWLVSWWRDKGRKLLAEKFAGYKHHAQLARMGVTA